MAVNRFYSSNAVATTLTNTITGGAVSMVVGAVTGFPGSFPYSLIIDPDGLEEVVTVTAGASTTLTITRGVDGTSAIGHNAGVGVRHGVSARDFREPQDHINDTTTPHGVTGAAVGTTNTQTLTGKTLTAPIITNPAISGGGSLAGTFTGAPTLSGAVVLSGSPTITTPTIASFVNATHTHTAASSGGTGIPEASVTNLVADLAAKEATANKGAANGYASLVSGTVPIAQIPTGSGASQVPLGTHTHTSLSTPTLDLLSGAGVFTARTMSSAQSALKIFGSSGSLAAGTWIILAGCKGVTNDSTNQWRGQFDLQASVGTMTCEPIVQQMDTVVLQCGISLVGVLVNASASVVDFTCIWLAGSGTATSDTGGHIACIKIG